MRKLAIGLLAAASVMVAVPAHAQGFWFGAPGFGIGVGAGYDSGPYYSDAYWGPGRGGRVYSSYGYAPAYSEYDNYGYDNYGYAPGYGYEARYGYNEPYSEPGYALTYEPSYDRRYVRSTGYSRSYVDGYASTRSYRAGYIPSRRARTVYSDSNRSRLRSANVIQTRSATGRQTVGSAVRTDSQSSARYRARRGQD
jgi:hypothetical protein